MNPKLNARVVIVIDLGTLGSVNPTGITFFACTQTFTKLAEAFGTYYAVATIQRPFLVGNEAGPLLGLFVRTNKCG